jgi:two-component system, chemotaxis family, response regulator Rcp1
MSDRSTVRPVEILLIEDSPSDADLAIEAFGQGKILNNLHFVEDGVEASFYTKQHPTWAYPVLI